MPINLFPTYLYKALEESFRLEELEDTVDWSQKTLMYLALAHYCTNRLKTLSNDTAVTFERRELVLPSIERAWREMLHVRLHLEDLGISHDKITLTRFGHLYEND
jgi:hypothetical protein